MKKKGDGSLGRSVCFYSVLSPCQVKTEFEQRCRERQPSGAGERAPSFPCERRKKQCRSHFSGHPERRDIQLSGEATNALDRALAPRSSHYVSRGVQPQGSCSWVCALCSKRRSLLLLPPRRAYGGSGLLRLQSAAPSTLVGAEQGRP